MHSLCHVLDIMAKSSEHDPEIASLLGQVLDKVEKRGQDMIFPSREAWNAFDACSLRFGLVGQSHRLFQLVKVRPVESVKQLNKML